MTDVDEGMLTAAKLRELVENRAAGGERLSQTVGLSPGPRHEAALSFVERAERANGRSLESSRLGRELLGSLESRHATRSLQTGDLDGLSYLVGITEEELSADAVTVLAEILDAIENNEGPMQLVMGGKPETGKTNTTLLVARLWQTQYPEGEIITNMSTLSWKDHYCDSCSDLLDLLLAADSRQLVLIDEASSWFESTSFHHEVKHQWAPLTKRFAKFAGDAGADSMLIGHTLMDVAPTALRLATVVGWKETKTVAQFYNKVDDDNRELSEPLFPDPLEPVEKVPDHVYDPNDVSPWSWDLDPEVFESMTL